MVWWRAGYVASTRANANRTTGLPNTYEFTAKVLSSPNKQLKERIGTQIASLVADDYLLEDSDVALAQARLASMFALSPDNLNNVGYVYLALGDRSEAETLINRAAVQAEEEKKYTVAALAWYNLAMCKILSLNREDAIAMLSQARQLLAANFNGVYEVRCLFVPILDGDALTLKEMWEPELSASIEAAIAVLETSPASNTVKLIRK